MTVLTKTELVKAFAEEYNKTQKEAAETLDQVFSLVNVLVKEEQVGVKLGDVGTLKVEVVPEREHGIPKSTEKVIKPEHYAVKFKVNSAFKRDLEKVKVQG